MLKKTPIYKKECFVHTVPTTKSVLEIRKVRFNPRLDVFCI